MSPAAPVNGALDGLKAAIWGNVILPEDGEAWQKATKVWSVSPFADGGPALVVQARGTKDVQAAVNYAREQGLPLAVKGGGHGPGNPSHVKGGLMLDLSLMRSCTVDPLAKTAVADGGCRLGDIDRETGIYNLAVPLGTAPVTGMGLVTNGGYGVVSRLFGPTCQNILEVQMVTADGSVVTVNKDSKDQELFWAVRGAASTLGVVTKIKFQLHDMSTSYTGFMMWVDDPEHKTFRALVHWMRDVGAKNPNFAMNLFRILDHEKGSMLGSQMCYIGSEAEADKAAFIAPLRDLSPVVDTVGIFKYADTQAALLKPITEREAAFPVTHEYWTGGFNYSAEQVNEEFVDSMVNCLIDGIPEPCFLTLSVFEILGGAFKTTGAPIGYAGAEFGWVIMVGWADPAAHSVGVEYARRVKQELSKYSTPEAYVNFTETRGGDVSAKEAAVRVGGADRLERIRAVKGRYDPANFFSSTPFAKLLGAADNSKEP